VLETITPFQFDRGTLSGRTRPARLTAETGNGEVVEAIVKLDASCDRSVNSLAAETISALLAGTLGLPVPQPYLVQLTPEWVDTINDVEWAAKARQSCSVVFGSKALRPGFSEWIEGTPLLACMVQTAAAILLFDGAIDNPDRRSVNPNCLIKGDEIRIIDHEMAFHDNSQIIGWQPPWNIGGLNHFRTTGAHIFRDGLCRANIDWEPIRAGWLELSDQHIDGYAASMPNEWYTAGPLIGMATGRIKSVRDHIDECILEVQRVLE
jgi:hypothetical protein